MIRRSFTLIELLFVVAIIAVLAGIAVPNFLEAQVRSKIARAQSDIAVTDAALRAYFADYNAYPVHDRELLFTMLRPMAEDHTLRIENRTAEQRDEATSEMIALFGFDGVTSEVLEMMDPMLAQPSFNDPFAAAMYADFFGVPVYWMDGPNGDQLTASGKIAYLGKDLSVLTTPVGYFSFALATDPFSDERNAPLTYLNYVDIYSGIIPADQLAAKYAVLSWGPDTKFYPIVKNLNVAHYVPTPYDATNGTVSYGDVFILKR